MANIYTARIIDGETTSFADFAKHCSRAFMTHMHDEPLDSEYVRVKPTDRHLKAIKTEGDKLTRAAYDTNEEILSEATQRLYAHRDTLLASKKLAEVNLGKLKVFLDEANAYVPPTSNHENIGKFMVNKLESTIESDCDISYYVQELKNIDHHIDKLNVDDLRAEMVSSASDSIVYHAQAHETQVKACAKLNAWYDVFIANLPSDTEEG